MREVVAAQAIVYRIVKNLEEALLTCASKRVQLVEPPKIRYKRLYNRKVISDVHTCN